MRVVLDTCSLIDGLEGLGEGRGFTEADRSVKSMAARVVTRILWANLDTPLYDRRMLAEYEGMLRGRKCKFSPTIATEVLQHFVVHGDEVFCVPSAWPMADEDDRCFAEVAVYGVAGYLITSNIKHFASVPGLGGRVGPPKSFLQALGVEPR